MKRLNPNTNQPFKYGDVREDGYLFKGYITYKSVSKNTGYFYEDWINPKSFKLHKDNNLKSCYSWRKKNPEKQKKNNLAWQQNNLDKCAANAAKRRATLLQRTPKWLTANQIRVMQAFYQIAAMLSRENGEPWHVDHILPLNGKNVSGLHVPSNLRVIPGSENVKKSNKYTA